MRAWISCVLLLVLLAGGVSAQRGGRASGPAHGIEMPGGLPKLRNHRDILERWNQMTPEQRRRALEKLPPERRRAIQNRIDRLNSLPKAEQERLRDRYQQFLKLPPAKQEMVRNEIKQFNRLPDERRQALKKEFAQMRSLPESERAARLDSEDYRSRFSPAERQMLRDLSETLVPLVPPSK